MDNKRIPISNVEQVILNCPLVGKDWIKGWEEITSNFIEELKRVRDINQSSLSVVEKYLLIRDTMNKYKVRSMPVEILEEILSPEVEKMVGVRLEKRNGAVVLVADTLEVTFKIEYDMGIYTEDKEPYEHCWHYERSLHESNIIFADNYDLYRDGKLSRFKMIKKLTNEYCEQMDKKAKRYDKRRIFINTYWGFLINEDYLKCFSVDRERFLKEELENEPKKEKNRVRILKRQRILDSSGLWAFLQLFIDEGIVLKKGGGLNEDFYPDVV